MFGWMKKCGSSMVLGLLLVTLACSETSVEPLASSGAGDHGSGKLEGFFVNPRGNGLTCDPSGKPDEGTGSPLQSAEWIDRNGGSVAIYGTSDTGEEIAHVLSVPKNAVRDRTLFCMRLDSRSHMQMRLKATMLTKIKGVPTEINVGKEGFREPVDLYMSYVQARVLNYDAQGAPVLVPVTPEEANLLYVAYEPDNMTTPTDRMPTQNLAEYNYQYIAAKLPHFSKYVMMLD
jgi:hypothetical protein